MKLNIFILGLLVLIGGPAHAVVDYSKGFCVKSGTEILPENAEFKIEGNLFIDKGERPSFTLPIDARHSYFNSENAGETIEYYDRGGFFHLFRDASVSGNEFFTAYYLNTTNGYDVANTMQVDCVRSDLVNPGLITGGPATPRSVEVPARTPSEPRITYVSLPVNQPYDGYLFIEVGALLCFKDSPFATIRESGSRKLNETTVELSFETVGAACRPNESLVPSKFVMAVGGTLERLGVDLKSANILFKVENKKRN